MSDMYLLILAVLDTFLAVLFFILYRQRRAQGESQAQARMLLILASLFAAAAACMFTGMALEGTGL